MVKTTATVQVRKAMARSSTVLPGLATAVAIAAAAYWCGGQFPIVGGPILAIVIGACIGPALRRPHRPDRYSRLRPGFSLAGKHVLQLSIVVLGTGLSLGDVVHIGGRSLPVLVSTLTVALGGAWILSRLLGIHRETAILVGVGTGVCGASAIATVTAVLGAAEARVAYALGTIFTFNIAAIAIFPLLGHYLHLSQQGFGLWAGTAINDTSSVVAAAYGYGTTAGAYAVVVKLTRTLAIVPICLALQARQSRNPATAGSRGRGAWRVLPPFIAGFLVASVARTVGIVPDGWNAALAHLSTFLVCVALAGIGLSLELAHVRRAGPRPLLLGAILWLAVAATGLGVQALTGTL